MNIVKKLGKHTIYYYCDNKIKYYINVPHKEFNTTNISLEFLENTSKYDPDVNDIEWVKQNIIEYYEKVDIDNITLVMPILKTEEKNMFLSLNVNKLSSIEKLMALYINSSYLSLVKNNINVNKEVFLVENDKYINFINYFKNKHNSRIIVKRLIEITNDINCKIETIPIIDNSINNNSENINKELNKIEENKNIETKPFSINENILNDVLINDTNDINNEKDLTIESNILINDNKDIHVVDMNNDNSKSNSNIILKEEIKNEVDNSEKTNTINNNLKDINTNNVDALLEKNDNIKVDKESVASKNIDNDKNVIKKENDNVNDKIEITPNEEIKKKEEEIKVKNIIIPNEDKKESVNNIINISDLGSLSSSGLNGALPGNVTINIEKLVTDNNINNKVRENINDEADEISELDEDISDIDEFDENENFDIDAIDVSEAVLSTDDSDKKYRTVISGGIKFVVGRKDDDNLKPIEINKSTNNLDIKKSDLNIEMPSNIIKGDNQLNKNAGFASYFTLFFVAISAIFIIVYIIVK